MGSPEVPIDVDPATGIWRTDRLPMIYLPRHFLVNNHVAVEEALGREAYRGVLRRSTEKSAIHWCKSESKTHGIDPEMTFRHYFRRLSQRGWGQFSVDSLDVAGGGGEISLRNSVFALEAGVEAKRRVCYMFEGFMSGAFKYLLESRGRISPVSCDETQCSAEGKHEDCRFRFKAG